MSVVNKMLRDLENRQQPQQTSANYIAPNKPKKLWLGLGVAACLVLSAAVVTTMPQNADIDRPAKHDPSSIFETKKGDQLAQTKTQFIGQAPIQDVGQAPNKVIGQALNQHVGQASVHLAKAPRLMDLSVKSLNQQSLNMNEFEVKASDGLKGELSNLRALAHLASQQGNDAKVISLLHQILKVDETEIRTRKQLAALLFSKSQFAEAQIVLSTGLEQDPSDSSLRLMLSRIHFKAGNNFDAFNVLIQHPFNQLANDELLSFRAALAEKIGEHEIAQQDYQLLVQRNPLEAKWWLGLGVAQDKQHLNREAIDSYQQAQQLKQLPAKVETFVEQRIQLLARQS